MSGHAILDSCHNCGAHNVELFVVDVSPTSLSCKHDPTEGHPSGLEVATNHHIHVFTACASCKKAIWEKGNH